MKYKLFPAPFFNHIIQTSPRIIAKLNSLHVVLRGQVPPLTWSHPFVARTPYDNFKIYHFPPKLISKSYKYNNYDKTTYKVSPYC